MKKDPSEMNFEDWEFLPDKEFLDLSYEDGKSLFSREKGFNPKGATHVNNFVCPSPRSCHPRTPENSSVLSGKNQLVSVPIQLELPLEKDPDGELVKEIREIPSTIPPVIMEKNKALNMVGDEDMIPQVFFKKMKENEFVDMKIDSPRSCNRGLKPQIEVGPTQIEEKEEAYEGENCESRHSKMVTDQETGKNNMGSESEGKGYWEGVSFNIFGWRVKGYGALSAIGVAAATICIFIFGNQQRNKQQQQNQRLQVQIYKDDKRIKQVVHHATGLNQALLAVRGVPLANAQITFGGNYDGL
ncbi:uncharacterized protein LOC143845704 [Tasmannia lanceolata]|uniref:uncharacterized protein LOC143845704 n=1 Tax=Tasmannia lanceolata TaxID=3420 RepID=UPI00406288C8